MVLTLTVFYEIPQLNVGSVFLLKSDEYVGTNTSTYDTEKTRIQSGATSSTGIIPPSLGSSTVSATPFGSYGRLNYSITNIRREMQ